MKESFKLNIGDDVGKGNPTPEIAVESFEKESTVDGLLTKTSEFLRKHPKTFTAFKALIIPFIMSQAHEAFGQNSPQEAIKDNPSVAGQVNKLEKASKDTLSKENLNFILTREAYSKIDRSGEYTDKSYEEKMKMAGDLAVSLNNQFNYFTHLSQAVLLGRLIAGNLVDMNDPSTFDKWEGVFKKAALANKTAVSFLANFGSYDSPEKGLKALDSVMSFDSDLAAENASQIIVSYEQLTENDWSVVDFSKLTDHDIDELYSENKLYEKVTPEIVAEKIK